jgi:hypothetical protein
MLRTRKFPNPIVLKDGQMIVTIGDARELMTSLAPGLRDDPDWTVAGDQLQSASIRHDARSLSRARTTVIKVLKAEGLL